MNYPTDYATIIFPKAIWGTKKMIKYISKNFNNPKVLDVGCGAGYFLFELSEAMPIEGYGVDIDEDEIKKCKTLNNKQTVKFLVGSSYKLNFKDNYFDIVLLSHVLEHLKNPLLAIKEIHRVLKNKGILIIGSPTLYKGIRISSLLRLDMEAEDHIVRGFSKKQLEEMLEKFNFETVKYFYVDKLFSSIITDIIFIIAKYEKASKKHFHIKNYGAKQFKIMKFIAGILSYSYYIDELLPLKGSDSTIISIKK